MPNSEESKRVLTEIIKRQIAILGPDITLAKVKNVAGLEVDNNGNVTNVTGDTQEVLQNLINQFVELSGLIVKKTMESIIMGSAGGTQIVAAQIGAIPTPVPTSTQSIPDSTPHMPEGYSIGANAEPVQQVQAPQQPASASQEGQAPQNPELAEANRDIEDLNKMLSNLNFNQPQK